MTPTKLPLVCPEALRELEDSLLGERSLCRNFVCRYIDMLPRRVERIHDAVLAGHYEAAMDAALSLRSSSMMVGAARLGDLTTDFIHLLKNECHAAAAKKLTKLRLCGNRTTRQLAVTYLNMA